MNISSLSMSTAVSNADTGIGMVLLSKVLDNAEVTSEAFNKMVETSGIPGLDGLGAHIDMRI